MSGSVVQKLSDLRGSYGNWSGWSDSDYCKFASYFSKAEFNCYCRAIFGSTLEIFGGKIVDIDGGILNFLKAMPLSFATNISARTKKNKGESTISPFNCLQTMIVNGYSVEVKAHTEFKRPADVSTTLWLGSHAVVSYPSEGYSFVFTKDGNSLYAPILWNHVNTRFLSTDEFVVPLYDEGVARLTYLIANLCSWTAQKMEVIVTSSNYTLLFPEPMFSSAFKNFITTIAAYVQEIIGLNKSSIGLDASHAHGVNFLHFCYCALIKMGPNDGVIKDLINTINKLGKCTRAGKEFPYVVKGKYGLIFGDLKLVLPRSFSGVKFSIHTGTGVTTELAYAYKKATQSIRLQDRAERGAIARTAYIGIPIDPRTADVCYLAFNIEGFVFAQDKILLDASDTETDLTLYLDALNVINYSGKVFVCTSRAKTYFKYDKKKNLYTYGIREITVYSRTEMRKIKYDGLYIDVASVPNVVEDDNMSTWYAACEERVETTVDYYTGKKFVSRISAYPTLVNRTDLQFYMPVQGHNLVLYYTNMDIKRERRVVTLEDYTFYLCYSIACNYARLVSPYVNYSPKNVLKCFKNEKNKSYSSPHIAFPDALYASAIPNFDEVDVSLLHALDAEKLREVFKDAPAEMIATMLKDEKLVAKLGESATSKEKEKEDEASTAAAYENLEDVEAGVTITKSNAL